MLGDLGAALGLLTVSSAVHSSHDIAGHWVPSWEPLNWIYVLMRHALKSEEHHIKTIVFKPQACCKPFC